MEEQRKFKVIEVAKSGEETKMEFSGDAFRNTLLAITAYGELRDRGVKIEDIPQVADILKSIAEMDIKT